MSGAVESRYHKLQTRPLEVGEKEIARCFEFSRFDPRLMEVSTEFIRDFWWNINPKILNKALKTTKHPYSIKPALMAIIKTCGFPSESTKIDFIKWHEIVLAGIKNPPMQLFYIGLNRIGSKSMEREVEESLPFFTYFNLLSKDAPFNKGRPGVVKTLSDLKGKRFDHCDLVKSEMAHKIKDAKIRLGLKNSEITERFGINRMFLSKILNNDLEGISADYLIKKANLADKA